MKILFTGASSFTGTHFVRALAAAGHGITATFQQPLENYDEPLRQARVQLVAAVAQPVVGCRFGDPAFLDLIRQGGFDVLAHHAADVTNYKSPDFDTVAAVQNNTHNLPTILQAFQEAGGQKVLLSGSVFEGGEGSGSQGLPDFSPYGLSKALTARVFQFYCDRQGLQPGQVRHPEPLRPLRRAPLHRLPDEELAGR